MMYTSKILSFVLGVGVFISQTHAETCDWAKQTPDDDAKYKYFVAREFSTKSRKDARSNAEANITQQVCNVVGSYLSAATDSYEDENITNSTSSTAKRSRCLGIYKQNFELLQTDDGRIDDEYVACVKYRYLKDNLRQEQARLNKEGTISGSMALNEYIGNTECAGHPLEIKTNPNGALVSIDDLAEYSGRTPLRFGNVCDGSHSLTITLDNYDTIKESISSQDTQIFKKLNRTTRQVGFKTDIGNSIITVYDADDFKLKSGVEPLYYDFLLGVEYKIGAENDKANSMSISKTFDKKSDTLHTFPMTKLGASIDFTVFRQRNPEIRIFVDGSEISDNKAYQLKSDVSHKIVFKKSGGFRDISKSVSLAPKQEYSYPSDELTFEQAGFFLTKYDTLDEAARLWLGAIYNMGVYSANDFNTNLKSVGVSGNIFLGKRFSLDFNAAVGSSKASMKYGTRDYELYVQNTSAATLFQNYDMYSDFEIEQSFLQYYGGLSWYFFQYFWGSPFVGIGYNKISGLSYKVNHFDSNFLNSEYIEEKTRLNTGNIMGSIGIQSGIFRITGRYSPEYYDVSCGITMPIKI